VHYYREKIILKTFNLTNEISINVVSHYNRHFEGMFEFIAIQNFVIKNKFLINTLNNTVFQVGYMQLAIKYKLDDYDL